MSHPTDFLSPRKKSGLTLTEVMIATSISLLTLTAVMGMFTQVSRGLFVSEQRIIINENIRKLTSEMSQTARQSNRFALYSSFATTDRDEATDQLQLDQSGDFVVFVSYAPYASGSGRYPIRRLVGYHRSPANPADPNSTGPVREFDISISPASTEALETLLPAFSTRASHREIIPLSRGLSGGKAFFNFRDRSLMFSGQIYHGNVAKEVSDTFNFTVSPRS